MRTRRSLSGFGRLLTSPREPTAALSRAACGFAWHGAGGCSPKLTADMAASISRVEGRCGIALGFLVLLMLFSFGVVLGVWGGREVRLSENLVEANVAGVRRE